MRYAMEPSNLQRCLILTKFPVDSPLHPDQSVIADILDGQPVVHVFGEPQPLLGGAKSDVEIEQVLGGAHHFVAGNRKRCFERGTRGGNIQL